MSAPALNFPAVPPTTMNPITPPLVRALFALMASAVGLVAQTRPAPPAPADVEEKIVVLSQFEVNAQGDDGYKAANAISGTRFNTALLDLPRPIEVITSEFIEDIGAKEIGEALKYSGSLSDNGTATPEDVTGNNFYNRGFQSFTSYRNGYRSFGVADTLFIDRVEIIKGPSSSSIVQSQFAIDLSQQLTPHWVFRTGGYFRSQRQARNTMAGSQALVINAVTRVRTVARVPTLQLTGNDNYIVQGSVLGDNTYGDIKHKLFAGFEYLGVVDQRNQQYRRPTTPPNLNVDSTNPADYALGAWSTYTTRFADTMLDSVQRGYTLSNIVQLFRSRLLLMQGYRYGQFYQNNENRLTRTASATSQSADVGSYGASFRVAPRLTFFVSYAESFQPQTASDFSGQLFEPITGKGWDLGPKFDLIEGKLSGTLVAFEIERSNILQPDPDHPSFNIASGVDRSRGIEFTLNARPVPAWQVVLSYANVDVETIKDPTRPQNVGLTPPNVARNQSNLWNRYSVQGGPLKGLGLGVGVNYVGERRGNPNLADIPAYRSPAYTRFDANLTYARRIAGRNLSFSLALQNLTDEHYYASYTAMSEPFSGMFSVMMRF